MADLAFEVGALLQEAAGFIDEAIPDVDIGDAGLADASRYSESRNSMSDVPLGPRTAGRPTQTTGTPFDFTTAIISSIFLV